MKTLYLVRHAKSSWDHAGLKDFERPLMDKGIMKTGKAIQFLQEKKVRIDLMVSSPAVRAIETAKLFAEGLGYPADKIITDLKIYEGNTDNILDIIYATDNSVGSLMLFGHNPNLSILSGMFLNPGNDFLPTSGVACISFSTDKWNKIFKADARKEFLIFPGKL